MKKIAIFVLSLTIILSFIGCGEAGKLNSFINSNPKINSDIGRYEMNITPTSFINLDNKDDIGLTTKEGYLCYCTKKAVENMEIGQTYNVKFISYEDSDIITVINVISRVSNEDASDNSGTQKKSEVNDSSIDKNDAYKDWTNGGLGSFTYKLPPSMNESISDKIENTEVVTIQNDRGLIFQLVNNKNQLLNNSFSDLQSRKIADIENTLRDVKFNLAAVNKSKINNISYSIIDSTTANASILFGQRDNDFITLFFYYKDFNKDKDTILNFLSSVKVE